MIKNSLPSVNEKMMNKGWDINIVSLFWTKLSFNDKFWGMIYPFNVAINSDELYLYKS